MTDVRRILRHALSDQICYGKWVFRERLLHRKLVRLAASKVLASKIWDYFKSAP